MSISNAIPRTEGIVGERRTVNGTQYEKSKNGGWKILHFSKAVVSHIRKELAKGKTQQEVADELKLTRPCISHIAKNNGFASFPDKMDRAAKNKLLIEKHKGEIKRLHTREHVGAAELKTVFGFSSVSFVESYLKSQSWQVGQSDIAKSSHRRGRNPVNVERHQDAWDAHLATSLPRVRSFVCYRHLVRRLTAAVLYEYVDLIDPRNRRSPEFHIDHQLSIFSGYNIYSDAKNRYVRRKELVPLHLICHPANLKLMPRSTNSRKSSQNHLTEKELCSKILAFEKTHGKVFV